MPYGSPPPKKKPQKKVIENKLKKKPRVKIGKLTDKQEKALSTHAKHHTRKHILFMEKLMKGGVSFAAAHKKAMSEIGK